MVVARLRIRPTLPSILFALTLLTLSIATSLPARAAEPSESGIGTPIWSSREVQTSIRFSEALLADMGLEIRDLETSAPAFAQHPLSVMRPGAPTFAAREPWTLRFAAPGRHFEDFVGGELRHQGGFTLSWKSGTASLRGFVLRPGSEPRTFEVLDAAGETLFVADHMHMELYPDAGRLDVFNLDLRISESFATRLGEPSWAGLAVGSLALRVSADAPADLSPVLDGTCPDNWAGIVDVALIDIGSVGQSERMGGRVSITPSARLKNVGTADVPWHSKFSGTFEPYDNDQHPYLVWALYRNDGGIFRQLAISDVKHAFLTINSSCTGCNLDSHILGLGCEDVYGEGTNESYGSLSYRSEIDAHSGKWSSTGSHFDQDGNGSQDHPPNNPDSGFDHRLHVAETELQVPGALYYFEAWYVVRDDVNIFNTMGYRRIAPSLGSFWTFPTQTALISGSAVDAWVDPTNLPAGAANETLDTGEGNVKLAVATTDLGGGQTRYVYALMNHDFDRQISSFSVPVAPGTTVTNPVFFDQDDDAGTDWTVSIGASSITWTLPGSATAGLEWGTMLTFGFEADAGPGAGTTTLGVFEAGDPTSLQIPTLGAGASELFADGFESGNTSSWSATVP